MWTLEHIGCFIPRDVLDMSLEEFLRMNKSSSSKDAEGECEDIVIDILRECVLKENFVSFIRLEENERH